MFPTIIAFSTGAQHYHTKASRLSAQCEKFGYPQDIEIDISMVDHQSRIVEGLHPRHVIYRFIPTFILWKLRTLNTDLLYLHCDYQIKKTIPEEAWKGLDVGLQKRWAYAVERSNFPMLAAPIYIRNNSRARRFLKMYECLCLNLDEDRGEHVYLRFLWNFMKRDRSLRMGYFDPHIATLQFDEDAPIVGHKSD